MLYINESNIFADEKGNATLEAAILVPIIICIISFCLLLAIEKYHEAEMYFERSRQEYKSDERYPKSIINNTDLAVEYIERIKSYFGEGET